jgi:hypothetical protein
MDRNAVARAHQQRLVSHLSISGVEQFMEVLAGPELVDSVHSLMPGHRRRVFPPVQTLAMFMAQALSADRACQNVVNGAALRRIAAGGVACSTHTGGYCQARKRLSTHAVSTLARGAGEAVCARMRKSWCWQGRPVRLVDGTTLRMPDTASNQDAFAQPSSERPRVGYPICRLVTLTCLGSGALIDAAIGRYQGKGADENTLLRSILDALKPGEVLVGDALYATYFLLATLQARGIDALFEQHGSRRRSTDFRCGQRLGTRDHLIVLVKPQRPHWMSAEEYERMPDQLTVRELRTGGRTLMGTLLCPKQAPKAELWTLYRARWHVELDLRNIKTTLGMQMLRCQSAPMVIKEIWVYLLAYNLIRLMMAKAAALVDVLPRQLSFKHAVQVWNAWTTHTPDMWLGRQLHSVLMLIAQQRVGERPGRVEPRALKRRPKAYPLLTQPRAALRAKLRLRHPRISVN